MKLLARIPQLLAFSLWSLFLVYLLIDFRYIRFLRPEFGILLGIAHFIFLGFVLTSLIHASHQQLSFSAVLRILVLCLPIACALIIPHALLGSADFHNRYTGQTQVEYWSFFDPKNFPAPKTPEKEASLEEYVEVSMLDIFAVPHKYRGKAVKLTAILLKDEQLKPYFGISTAVYRFLITCCAADAMPLAIGLDIETPTEYEQDQWVEVTAIFDIRTVNGTPMPFLSNPVIVPVAPPTVPWLL